jgi:hypothetical protein
MSKSFAGGIKKKDATQLELEKMNEKVRLTEKMSKYKIPVITGAATV